LTSQPGPPVVSSPVLEPVDSTASVVPAPVPVLASVVAVPGPVSVSTPAVVPVLGPSEVELGVVSVLVGAAVVPLSETVPSPALVVGWLAELLDEPGSPVLGPVLVLPLSVAVAVAVALSTVSSPQAPRPSKREDARIHGDEV
jgi:hypothetical protein